MTDEQQIVCFLSAYYLAECLYWARAGAVVFVSQFGERHRPRTPFQSVGLSNQHGGLIPGNLIPWGDSTLGQVWPFSVSPEGVAAVAPSAAPDGAPEATGLYRSWSNLAGLRADQSAVLIDDAPFTWAGSPDLAAAHVAFLKRLAAAPHDERAAMIDRALAESFDSQAAAQRLTEARRGTRWLRCCCLALFLYVFVTAPLVAFAELPIPLFALFFGYFAFLIPTLATLPSSYRRVFPEGGAARNEQFRKQLLMATISPADAAHARNSLMRSALESYQPLALAAALCPRAHFEGLARAVLLDLEYPLPSAVPSTDPAGREAADWFRGRFSAAVLDCLQRNGVDPERLIAPPTPDGPDSTAYCPRCHGQYTRNSGRCYSCDQPLRPLVEAALNS